MRSPLKIIRSNTVKFKLDKAIQVLVLLTVFSIPYNLKLNNILVIALSILIFVYAYLERKKINKPEKKKLLLFSSLYLIQIVGLLYTENLYEAKHQLEVKFPILLFPMIFSLYTIGPALKKKTLFTFLLSCNIICLVGLYLHFTYFLDGGYPLHKFFTNINYLVHTGVPKLSIHPVYLSCYLFLAFLISYYSQLITGRKKLKIALIFNMLFLGFFILILSSRIIIITFVLFLFFILFDLLRRSSVYVVICSLVAIFTLLSSILFVLPITKNKLQDIYTEVFVPEKRKHEEINGVSNRIQKWKASSLVIKENFFLGVGTGDANDHLFQAYRQIDFEEGIKRKYNAHNEYFQEFIRHGIIGLVILLSLYIYSISLAIKRRDKIYLFFMVAILAFSFTESFLSLQKGAIFFAFFNSLFAFSGKGKSEGDIEHTRNQHALTDKNRVFKY